MSVGPLDDRLLQARDVAALLNVSPRWVKDKTRQGVLPVVRLGRFPRYRRSSILAWIADEERGGVADFGRRSSTK